MKVLYIADDGTQFEDEFKCIDYEWEINHPHLKEISFYDKDNKRITGNIFDESIYTITEKVILKSKEAVSDFQDFSQYTGFCEYDSIDSPGCWIWNDKKGFECKEKY